MDFWAKTHQERQDDEDSRLVRPSPSDKPPRRDLRRERSEPDQDPDKDDSSDQKDRSKNYKNIGGSLRERVIQRAGAVKERIPAKSRATGETVMISPDTLKEKPGEYEAIQDEEREAPPDAPKEPEEGKPEAPGTPEVKPNRDKYYQEAGAALQALAKQNPKLESKLHDFSNPEKPLAGIAKENPDFPAATLFPGIELPKELKTLGDIAQALAHTPKAPKTKGKGKKAPPETPSEAPAEAPKGEPPAAAPAEGEPAKTPEKPGEAPEKPNKTKKPKDEKPKEEEAPEAAQPEPEPTEAQKAGIQEPSRRPVNSAEKEEALGLLVDTFPPHVSAELIAKNLHPDDVKSLVRDFTAAKSAVTTRNLDAVITKASSFFQVDPSKVPPPTVGKNAAGEKVSFDDLNPEEQAEATRQHQLRVTAMSLAAQAALTDKLAEKGGLTGKDRIPRSLASTLANTILTKTPEQYSEAMAAQTFDTVLKSGSVQKIGDKAAQRLLEGVKKQSPAAHAIAKAYLQANDYALAKQKFLKGDDESLSEWQKPEDLLKGIFKAGRFFDERNAVYGDGGSPHPASTFFRSRVMSRLRALDPKKARMVQAALPQLEEKEYRERHRKWESRQKEWETKRQAHEKAVEAYLSDPGKKDPPGEFTEAKPVEPQAPAHQSKETGASMWSEDTALPEAKPEKKAPSAPKEIQLDEGERKEVAQAAAKAVEHPPKLTPKQSSTFTYPASPVMGSATKLGVYHGIDPYAYGPQAYPGWMQVHQRDIGEGDFEIILGMAKDWLKSPVLSVATDEMLPDARFRAALDLAIYDSPYNRALTANQYNQLLVRLSGEPTALQGETIRKEAHDYKTETRYLMVYGPNFLSREILAAVEAGEGHLTTRIIRQASALTEKQASEGLVPEFVLRVDFPEGTEDAAMRSLHGSLGKFQFKAEKTTPGYLPSFRKNDTSTFSPSPSDSTGGSTSMKASKEILKFAAQVASTHPKVSFEMLALAQRLAEEEKKMPPWLKDKVEDKKEDKGDDDKKKEASTKMASLKSLIIRQASSLDPAGRAPWLPVLQALKDLG